jgi:glycerol-3-phosphate cytidylyltransferase
MNAAKLEKEVGFGDRGSPLSFPYVGGRVLTYGTFDLFHIGHLNMLERLRAIGDELYVGVSTDSFNEIKGKRCVFSYDDRVRIVSMIKCVDRVFPEIYWGQKRHDIKNFNVSTFGIGNDWQGKFDDLSDICRVCYLPRTENISTTAIILSLRSELGASLR